MSLSEFEQLTVDGVVSGAAYALVGVAVALILSVTGRFHFALAFTYTISAYIASVVGTSWGLPFVVALIFGACVGTVIGVAIERFIYTPISNRSGANALMVIFVASLGISIAGENLIGLIWINSASLSISGIQIKGLAIHGITFTNLDVFQFATSLVLIAALSVLLRKTKVGRMIRAVRSNPIMSLGVGVNPERIFLFVFALGSFVAGVGAVFAATQAAATPDMGSQPLFYGFTVAFLAGEWRSPARVALIGLGIGLAASWSTLFVAPEWSVFVVFAILFGYVSLRPLSTAMFVRRLGICANPHRKKQRSHIANSNAL